MTPKVITEVLRVDKTNDYKIEPTGELELKDWELGWVAERIDNEAIEKMMPDLEDSGITESDRANIRSDNRDNVWNAMFDILVKWSRKKGNNKQVNSL